MVVAAKNSMAAQGSAAGLGMTQSAKLASFWAIM
jgi:hypothetical protein